MKLDGSPLDPTFISDALALGSGLCPSLATFTGDRDEDQFMPSVQVQWNPTSAVMAYAKWDKSYKSGGFNAAALATLADIEYEEEQVSGYEVGLKSVLAGGAAVLNLALFDTTFEDLQVTTLTGGGQALLSNAGKATSRGVEFDSTWAVTDSFTLGGSLAYLDAEYDEYEDGPCNAVQRSENVGSGHPCFQDLSGRPTSYAPRWSGHLFGDIGFRLTAGWEMRFRSDVVYSDDYYYDTDLDPNTKQDSYWKVDARITLADADGRWEFALLGKNLTDEAIAVWGTDIPLILGSYVGFTELPRTVTVQAKFRFGAE
jgi:outer membrane receptor protein involved in Fe transport